MSQSHKLSLSVACVCVCCSRNRKTGQHLRQVWAHGQSAPTADTHRPGLCSTLILLIVLSPFPKVMVRVQGDNEQTLGYLCYFEVLHFRRRLLVVPRTGSSHLCVVQNIAVARFKWPAAHFGPRRRATGMLSSISSLISHKLALDKKNLFESSTHSKRGRHEYA